MQSNGYYVIGFRLRQSFKGRVGRRLSVKLQPGMYIYIGSALGPVKFKTRVCRHLSKSKKPWWHIDYITLSPFYEPLIVTVCPITVKGLESWLALSAHASRCFKPIQRLGGSDDPHRVSHLYSVHGCRIDEAIVGLISTLPCPVFIYNAVSIFVCICSDKHK